MTANSILNQHSAGKFFRTRDGSLAYIVAVLPAFIRPGSAFRFMGIICEGNHWHTIKIYTAAGRCSGLRECEHDITALDA